MKHINTFILYLLLGCVTSCTVNKKITFYGTPGTEIYKPEQNAYPTKLGKIDDSGSAKIKLSRNGYTPYLLIYDNENNKFYPFGVDYYYLSNSSLPSIFNVCCFTPGLNLICLLPAFLNYKYINSDQASEGYRYAKKQFIPIAPNAPYPNIGERRKIDYKK